ncbi:MAG: electron transfer flavoprotein subunit alpha/FixB family protein [Clostridia bacterium]|nr:electron transfer flavoprotein subunit alpha/FixB family protein [Clostridia bacterium]
MKIAVYCEKMREDGLALIGKARAMAPKSRVIALCEEQDEAVLSCGADELAYLGLVLDDCAQACRVAEVLKTLGPDIALFPATVRGRFISAWAAAKLQTGLTADCTALSITEDGILKQTRPAYGSNLTADILCRERRPQMASVRPGVFPVPASTKRVEDRAFSDLSGLAAPSLLELLAHTPVEGGASLSSARVVVAGGKGVGGAEGFALLRVLAELLGGAVGATRSAVDAGYISYAHQVGQTGVTVRPELYIAFGISGMIQHTVGMSAARTVVAVNTDKNAPIFRSADYGIVAPWRETALYMLQFIKERKGLI